MRRSIAHFALFLALVASLAGCASSPSSRTAAAAVMPPRPARINHLAFFVLKDPAHTQELIDDCDTYLATIPGVVSYYCGTHLDVGRPTVDGDYHVGFYVGFNTREDYAVYVDHANHKLVVNKWTPMLESLRVHDVIDETE